MSDHAVMDSSLRSLLIGIPKAELHIHIEGSLEPDLIFELAERNKIPIGFQNVEALRAAYSFQDLQSFLNLYYSGAGVLVTKQDFYDLAMQYFDRANDDNVVHTEIFFDPQTHVERGVAFEEVILGLTQARKDAEKKWGITSHLIMCFLRHLTEVNAFETLKLAQPHLNLIKGVGLDSSELGNPPRKFRNVFRRCVELGLRIVAHAGEEGPAAYVREALDIVGAERIDHGVRAEDDPELIHRLVTEQIPLTVCPLSNVKLRVVDHLAQHNLGRLLRAGACVTINSDDPAYFGGYIGENFVQTFRALQLSPRDALQLAQNSIEASFIESEHKKVLLEKAVTFYQRWKVENLTH